MAIEVQETPMIEYRYWRDLIDRKFALAFVIMAMAFVLCWFGKIDGGVFSVVAVTVIGATVTGEIFQTKNTKSSSF